MTKKRIRTKSSYYGNTIEAQKAQRLNLSPGNSWDKRHRKELKMDCWWEVLPLGNAQDIYELCENKRTIKDTPKEELKDEEFLDNWWKNELDTEDKVFIIKSCKGVWNEEDVKTQKKDTYDLLEKKIKEAGIETEERKKEREAKRLF